MKILHLIPTLGVGGAERSISVLVPVLQENSENQVCSILSEGPYAEELRANNIPVTCLSFSPRNLLPALLLFRRIVREYQPDVIVTYLIHADLFGRVLGRMFGVKSIVCSQRGDLGRWKFLRIADWLTSWLVTGYITQTEVAKEEISKTIHVRKSRFFVLPNSIEVGRYQKPGKPHPPLEIFTPNHPHVVCVGRLSPEKGHAELIRAVVELPDVQLLIVGDGPLQSELIALTDNLHLQDRVGFVGTRKDIPEILHASDIFILPTHAEGMSNAIMEGMASGLPVISTAIAVNQELVTSGETGILVPVGNVQALRDALQSLIQDKELASRLGTNAQNYIIQHHTPKLIAAKLLSYLTSLT